MLLNTKTAASLLLAATLGGVTRGWSAERLFAVCPVPQDGGDYVGSYFVSKTPMASVATAPSIAASNSTAAARARRS